MGKDEIIEAILCDDLRNQYISVGKLEMEMQGKTQEEKNEQLIKQLQSFMQSVNEVYTDFRAATQVEIREIKKDIENILKTISNQSELISKILAKLNNGISERLERLECNDRENKEEYVTRREFNGAMENIRAQVTSLKWTVGILMTGILGALVTLIFKGGF